MATVPNDIAHFKLLNICQFRLPVSIFPNNMGRPCGGLKTSPHTSL